MKTDFQNFIEDARILILGMSNSRSKSIQKIDELAEPITLHLALIAAYPDSPYQSHWRSELTAFMSRVIYYKMACKVNLLDRTLLQILYERPLGTTKDKAGALVMAKGHMQRGQKKGVVFTADEGHYFKFPFEQIIKELLINPDYLKL